MKSLSQSLAVLVLLVTTGLASIPACRGNILTPEVLSPSQEIQLGKNQLQSGDYESAADSFWRAIMRNDKSLDLNDLKSALDLFLLSYKKLDIPEQGFLKIGRQFILQGLVQEGTNYLMTALSINPKLVEAHLILMKVQSLTPPERLQHIVKSLEIDPLGYQTHFEVGSELFSMGSWSSSLAIFEKTFLINNTCWQTLSSLIYLRSYVCKWGEFGSQYHRDMAAIEQIINEEEKIKESQKLVLMKSPSLPTTGHQNQGQSEEADWIEYDQASLTASTIHTHMLLGYPISSELKLKVARMHTEHEQSLVRRSGLPIYSHTPDMYVHEAAQPDFRIKVGYVSANFKSKTTVYMAQDLFRFHDRSKFEVHVYATTPNDNPTFLASAMGGVNWREKVKDGVEFFHDVAGMHLQQVAELIQSHGIHILLDWDGHSNNMVRLSGLFPMQSAPIQVGHQEFIGTTGAAYIQYLITDKIASPTSLQYLYSEKFIYMPNTFLANSMAYLAPHIMPPALKRDSVDGSGMEKKKGKNKKRNKDSREEDKTPLPNNPKYNGCGGLPAEFVYCNFNKHLKFSPDVFLSWLTILQDSEKYLMEFINDFDESLASRVRFLPFVSSPFENQQRISRMCNAVLDTPVYNGHTCSVDALWGGVPLVVYGNMLEMASRVGVSMMSTLGLPELIARDQDDYNEIAIRLADDVSWYRSLRRRLVRTCYQTEPRHPLWDMELYVRDLEIGFSMIWQNFMAGQSPQNADISYFRKYYNISSSSDERVGSWMNNASKSSRTKKRSSVKPLLQYLKERKSSRGALDRGPRELQSSLSGITQGLWDVLGALDRSLEEGAVAAVTLLQESLVGDEGEL